jgi:hypothetical protein
LQYPDFVGRHHFSFSQRRANRCNNGFSTQVILEYMQDVNRVCIVMQILLLQESKLDCRLVVVGSRTSVISLTPPLLVRRSLVSIRPENGQKRSEKHLSRFHFHIFFIRRKRNGNVRNENEWDIFG